MSQLLHGVFEECNISFGKALCAKIAERVNATGVGMLHPPTLFIHFRIVVHSLRCRSVCQGY